MKLPDWVKENSIFDGFSQTEVFVKPFSQDLHVIGECKDCEKWSSEAEGFYYSNICKNSPATYGCKHFEPTK